MADPVPVLERIQSLRIASEEMRSNITLYLDKDMEPPKEYTKQMTVIITKMTELAHPSSDSSELSIL
ncbi:MAG: hypothetical protein ACTSUE_22850 [Promethearchaeota archaeon]